MQIIEEGIDDDGEPLEEAAEGGESMEVALADAEDAEAAEEAAQPAALERQRRADILAKMTQLSPSKQETEIKSRAQCAPPLPACLRRLQADRSRIVHGASSCSSGDCPALLQGVVLRQL